MKQPGLSAAKLFTCIALFVIFCVGIAAAESISGGRLCFRNGGPGCKTFLLTEAGMSHNLELDYMKVHIFTEVGALRKLNDNWALGGTVGMIYNENDEIAMMLAIKPRVRHWVYRQLYTDLSVGATFARISDNGAYYVAQPSMIGSLSVGLGDWAAVVLQMERLRFKTVYDHSELIRFPPDFRTSYNETNWYLGISVGSYPGAILAPLVIGLSIFAEYIGDNWD